MRVERAAPTDAVKRKCLLEELPGIGPLTPLHSALRATDEECRRSAKPRYRPDARTRGRSTGARRDLRGQLTEDSAWMLWFCRASRTISPRSSNLNEFTYFGHDHVFANAMSGKVVLPERLRMSATGQAFRHVLRIPAILPGVAAAQLPRLSMSRKQNPA
jgi:hypothetical protein